jgi:hypothetical protein
MFGNQVQQHEHRETTASHSQAGNREFRDGGRRRSAAKRPASAPRAVKAQRREFYRWLLGLSPGARIIRYGCDRYFNKLEKRSRPIRAKIKKKRPYPYWLQHYFFGSFEREQRDSQRAKERYLNELRGVYDDGTRRGSGGTVRMEREIAKILR